MLTEVADGVFVRQSEFCRSNAVVVRHAAGALLVDPGVDGADLAELADDLDALHASVAVGFATHPHWDHVLWHERFGDAPRYGTARCAARAAERRTRLRDMAARLAPGAPLDLVGDIVALPPHATHVPWDGPPVRVIGHDAHAPGHAALLIEGAGVLLAGDMLSDVEIPLLDPGAGGQCQEYLTALDLLADACADGVEVAVPGHGAPAVGADVTERLAADRAYVGELLDGGIPLDPRVAPGATYGADWLPQSHERNIDIARR